jgi:hypothetical protein
MTEKREPYTPYNFGPPVEWYAGRLYRTYHYTNYTGVEYPYTIYAEGKDELAAFIDATKHLQRLKRRADKRRADKEQTNARTDS